MKIIGCMHARDENVFCVYGDVRWWYVERCGDGLMGYVSVCTLRDEREVFEWYFSSQSRVMRACGGVRLSMSGDVVMD